VPGGGEAEVGDTIKQGPEVEVNVKIGREAEVVELLRTHLFLLFQIPADLLAPSLSLNVLVLCALSQIKLNRGTAYSGSPFLTSGTINKTGLCYSAGQRNFCQSFFFLISTSLPSDL
jgi:hypothetical protein